MLMLACPMTTLRALALHPAAIISDAKVWRHWCKVMGLSVSSAFSGRPSCLAFAAFAFVHAERARLRAVVGMNGSVAERPNTRSVPLRFVAVWCARSADASGGTIGTLRCDPFVFGVCS